MKKDLTINNAPAYYAYPDDGKRHPGIVLIEDIWGVGDHIKSVVDRFAREGYSVIAPEILPRELLAVLTPEFRHEVSNPETRNVAQPKMRAAMQPVMQPPYAAGALGTLKAAVDYLLADEHVNGTVGTIGFCFGGTYAFHLAGHDPRIKAAIPFYGQPPTEEEIANLHSPILAFYGDKDAPLMESLPMLKDTMKKYNRAFEAVVYPDAGHAFFNDSNPHAYKPVAAADSWKKALAFLKINLPG